ncbi:MAG: acetyl-CoA C-acyltransferase, partial [Actinomycetota bacterium]|nr:acetyl-CoA C-acyltransferase [Actinomycetota bacterium]
MPEAVIVSVARTPIGRANKGSLKDFRPDDLTALIIQTALDKIPELDPKQIEDLYL